MILSRVTHKITNIPYILRFPCKHSVCDKNILIGTFYNYRQKSHENLVAINDIGNFDFSAIEFEVCSASSIKKFSFAPLMNSGRTAVLKISKRFYKA